MGEGFHNYHHVRSPKIYLMKSVTNFSLQVFPWDYKAAELGNYKLNITTFWIDLFAKIGWAYDLKKASDDLVRRTVEKHGKI